MFTAFKALSIGKKIGAILLPLLILAGIFFAGAMYGGAKEEGRTATKIAVYKTEAQELRAELATAQKEVDVRVVTEYRDRLQEVEVERVVLQEVVKEVPVQYPLSNGWIYVHNSAVAGTIALDEKAMDATPSNVFDAEALPIIIDNYQTCKVNGARHNALIDWVKGTLASAEEINEAE